MKFYIARHPVFNRQRGVAGYKLELCRSLRDRFYGQYREPDDAEALYRQLCFPGFEETPARPLAILDFPEELFESLIPLLPRKYVVIDYDGAENSEADALRDIKKIKAQGYRVLSDATENPSPRVMQLADLAGLDFSALSADTPPDRAASGKDLPRYYARGVDTWENYKKAFAAGCEYFQGDFFMEPLSGRQSVLYSFSPPVLRVISELGAPEPSFKEITRLIEHDLNLAYNLLRRVNSAYVAPKFKVKTISQAITILGLKELNELMSTFIIRQLQSADNSELLRRALIRGKFMDLLAGFNRMPQKGSEAFFTGIFSLLDVILNNSMAAILEELPLTDAVKKALLGEGGSLNLLLDMVRLYEQGRWEEFDRAYNPDYPEQERMMNFYLSALKWAESFDI
ncbi:EAL and modified HD-GYP domain-containing signal transduction protein [Sporobacter termitidis DSM 10068]|uniref:EAL and modified HD-GYP domain-containing signal transduction protein n=1 Tax=Sporobacter termitidis DSM 10068 TaxID=1123282 RepID=A0A1M5Z9I5_9FIRM|nr:HDOD domain-containing protein [Sporobacter termitidis]SHI20852.1 EAL and modified HD-GYP domain-containing signal transduction protein [Sporobacter termitidis DSM 10068]